jgi:hypothetical protein
MEKEFVSYEIALALKELGFDEPCIAFYTQNAYGDGKKLQWFRKPNDCNSDYVFISAPLYQQVFRWFREKHKLIPNIHSIYTDETHTEIKFWFWVGNYKDDSDDEVFYGTYEEAQLECLKKLIEIVKEK